MSGEVGLGGWVVLGSCLVAVGGVPLAPPAVGGVHHGSREPWPSSGLSRSARAGLSCRLRRIVGVSGLASWKVII